MGPFTHHEILAIGAPFSRRGHRVDLGASDRAARQLVFQPIEHPVSHSPAGAGAVIRDRLALDNPAPGQFRLRRLLTHPRGLTARMEAEGPDPASLLERLSAIPPQSPFREGERHLLAFSQRWAPAPAAAQLTEAELLLDRSEGAAEGEGLRLQLKMATVTGYPAELQLSSPPGREWMLPDDLLAVLGRDWDCLSRDSRGWRGQYAARGNEPQRSRRAEAALEQAAEHLAHTLAAPPSAYHARQAGARWRVALRRLLPLAVITGLVGGSAAVPSLGLAQDSTWRMLIFNAPPLLVAFGLCLRELPRFELPRWPRPLRQAAWSRAQTVPPGSAPLESVRPATAQTDAT